MSAGPLIATGIGVLLLVATTYVLVGGALTTTEVLVEAQSNLAVNQEVRMRTAIAVQSTWIDTGTLYVEVKNTGSEPIVDIRSMDVYLYTDGTPAYTPFGSGVNTWSKENITPDAVHPGELDPGETLTLAVGFEGENPQYVQVVTGNGVSSSAYITGE
ncbi:flagellar protein FlaF [Methanoculleus sp. Wushi-C6]|uniref:Flagellar protein FlaF n=1 Tax=Methanoculleus caldifontis TaxID=2651577 RepID=A0ABU3X409_9EURY|nr:flagellar protein FlaF [Methanoculleus sp. Wushi-C6]MDV2482342.1 flagellar protein FlaF [Methanoculleus sp. Wushi-C6]